MNLLNILKSLSLAPAFLYIASIYDYYYYCIAFICVLGFKELRVVCHLCSPNRPGIASFNLPVVSVDWEHFVFSNRCISINRVKARTKRFQLEPDSYEMLQAVVAYQTTTLASFGSVLHNYCRPAFHCPRSGGISTSESLWLKSCTYICGASSHHLFLIFFHGVASKRPVLSITKKRR